MWALLDYRSGIATKNIRTALDIKDITTLQHYCNTYINSKKLRLTVKFIRK